VIRARIALAGLLLVLAVLLCGCMSSRAASDEAGAALAGVIEEAAETADSSFTVSVQLVRVEPTRPDTRLPLSAYEATYRVTVTSKECPAFHQQVEAARAFGPGAGLRIGGLHDWHLFRQLAKLDTQRRVAFEGHIASRSNPCVGFISPLDDSQPGGGWTQDDAALHASLLAVGQRRHIPLADLYWALIDGHFELLGFDAARGTWSVLATQKDSTSRLIER
jgi:hypothetical protein